MATRILLALVTVSILALGIGYGMMPSTRHREVESAGWNALQDFGGLMGGIGLMWGLMLEGRSTSKRNRVIITMATFVALGCLAAWFIKPTVTG